MGFSLGFRSLKELEGVHPKLVECVKLAIKLSSVDYTVVDGVRTPSEALANQLAGKGISRSKHLTGDAVDLAPWIGGKIVWSVEECYKIAKAMQAAEKQIPGLRLRWGGSWQPLAEIKDFDASVRAYVARKKKEKKPALVDAVHFERIV